MRSAFAAFLLIFAVSQVRPAGSADALLPSIQQIVDRGTLVIAVVDGARPPMVRRGDDGRLSGFDVELGSDIAGALGVKPEFVAAGPQSDDIITMVSDGGADIGLSYLSESLDGALRVFFTQPYMVEAHTVFINRVKGAELEGECPRMSDLRRLAKTENGLGIAKDSPYLALVQKGGGENSARRFDDFTSLVEAVESGEITGSLQGELAAKLHLSNHPAASILLQYCTVPGGSSPRSAG